MQSITDPDWVKTVFCKLFKEAGKAPHSRECIARMQWLHKIDPTVTREEIIIVTKQYLLKTDPRFIREPHYFIKKGTGSNCTTDLLSLIEEYREYIESQGLRKDIQNTIQ